MRQKKRQVSVERSAVGVIVSAISKAEATQGWAWPPLGLEPCMSGRDSVGAANRSPMARSARPVPGWLHLLEAVADVGRTRRLAVSLAKTIVHAGRAAVSGLGRGLPRRHVHHREKGGAGSRQNTSRERYEVHGGGRRPRHTCRSATCVRADCRVSACGKHAPASESAAARPWTPTFPSAARHR